MKQLSIRELTQEMNRFEASITLPTIPIFLRTDYRYATGSIQSFRITLPDSFYRIQEAFSKNFPTTS